MLYDVICFWFSESLCYLFQNLSCHSICVTIWIMYRTPVCIWIWNFELCIFFFIVWLVLTPYMPIVLCTMSVVFRLDNHHNTFFQNNTSFLFIHIINFIKDNPDNLTQNLWSLVLHVMSDFCSYDLQIQFSFKKLR